MNGRSLATACQNPFKAFQKKLCNFLCLLSFHSEGKCDEKKVCVCSSNDTSIAAVKPNDTAVTGANNNVTDSNVAGANNVGGNGMVIF